jgi:hypothetical protein
MDSSKQIRFGVTALAAPASAGTYFQTLIGLMVAFGIFCVGLLIYANRHGELPPAPLTSEVSFNEKAQFVRGMDGRNFDIITAGSSLAVNDITSDLLLEEIPSHPSMMNIAAFGLRITETGLWLNHVMRRFGTPKLVMICLSPLDFQAESGWYEPGDRFLDGYLAGKFQPSLYFNDFSLITFMDLTWHMKQDRTSRRKYSSLDFDLDGGVPLDMGFPNVDLTRWNYVFQYTMMDDGQYNALDRMAAELKSSGVSLVCIFPPTRRAGRARENAVEAEKYHSRVAEILQKNGQTLLNLDSTLNLDDSHFADYIHLNAGGAQAFSHALGRELASMPALTTNSVAPRPLDEVP